MLWIQARYIWIRIQTFAPIWILRFMKTRFTWLHDQFGEMSLVKIIPTGNKIIAREILNYSSRSIGGVIFPVLKFNFGYPYS